MRKRPRLAGVKADAANAHPCLLQHLAPDSVFDVLARLDEAGQRREHLIAIAVLVRQKAALTIADEHNHHRVGAWKPVETAGPAFAAPTAVLHQGGPAAVAATTRVLVPLGKRAGLAAKRQLLGRHR